MTIIVNKVISSALVLWATIMLARVALYVAKDHQYVSTLGLRMAYMAWATVFIQTINNLAFLFVDGYNVIDPAMKISSVTACAVLHYLHRALRDAK